MSRPLTESEMDAIVRKITWVSDRWARIPNIRPCAFNGGPEDVRALAYGEYEGLDDFFKGEAQRGYANFALVFGNVLVHQLGFMWAMDGDGADGRLMLRHENVTGLLDPVGLVRRESERLGWRCPKFSELYESVANVLSRGADLSHV